jgi:hypothetical protein
MSTLCLCAGLLSGYSLLAQDASTGKTDNTEAAALLRSGSWLYQDMSADTFGAAPAVSGASGAAQAEPEQYLNSVELSVGGLLINGDRAQFQQRYGMSGSVFGGVQDMHLQQNVGSRGLFTLDGHAIADNHDYAVTLSLSQPDLGYIHAGYNEFRTWFDGNGGFFPLNGQFFPPLNNQLALDRGDAWVEFGLRIPDFPEITVRYEHDFRYGQEDSTIWGITSLTGLPGPNNARAIVPSFRDIDERRDIVTGDAKQTFGNTDVSLGLRYEYTNNDDSLNFNQNPNTSGNSYVTQSDQLKSDMFTVHLSTETRFDQKLWFTTAYAYTALNSQIGGSRIYGDTYDPVYNPLFPQRAEFDEGFLALSGGSRIDQHVANLNLMWLPAKNFSVLAAVRIEDQNTDSDSSDIATNFVPSAHGIVASNTPESNNGSYDFLNVDESLELRYTGLTNWSFYARAELRQEQGHLDEKQIDLATNTFDLNVSTDESVLIQKYIVGANWYPLPRLNLSTQYYHEIQVYNYTNMPNSASYPDFLTDQDFNTDDVNIRVTWRPCNSVSLVSRYDFQRSTVDTKGDSLPSIQSAVITNHIFSEDINWSPFARFYIQGNLSYVLNQTDTPASGALPGPVVANFKNDYWDASCMAGFALDDKTDIQVQYSYYNANDYDNNAQFSQPYGSGAVEQSVTASISRQITSNLRLMVRYGYFSNYDETSGNHNNYQGHLVYSSLQIRF